MDYHTDAEHNVSIFGASAYFGLDRHLQEKFSVQLISQDDALDEPEFFWAIAAGGRFSPGDSVRPFVGLGLSFGEAYVCRHKPESGDSVRVFRDGQEVCLPDTLFTAFGDYGIYWLMHDRFFLEVSARHTHSSKHLYPFDSVVKGFSFGSRY